MGEKMSGFYIRKSGESIERVVQKSGALSLLGHGDGVEILIQEIKEGSISFLEPSRDGDLLEFFYVLEGEISCTNDGNEILLRPGDYFYSYNLSAPVELRPNSHTKLLYVSSRALFEYLSQDILVLKDILQRVEEKDAYTHGHGKRVRDISHAIGKKLNLPSRNMERLLLGALFHDIGKIEIPDEVLKKPSTLTATEFEQIKTHPVVGSEMVKNTFLEDTYDIIRHHHERLDGSGYPDGITGEDISIESRIVAVADSFDAMTSKRPYRDAMTCRQALTEIKFQSGTTYDSDVVEALEASIVEGLV